jgi:preprotein translocase subunit SecG
MGAFGGGSSNVFGARGTTTILSRLTTGLATAFMVLSIILARYSVEEPRTTAPAPTPPAAVEVTPADPTDAPTDAAVEAPTDSPAAPTLEAPVAPTVDAPAEAPTDSPAAPVVHEAPPAEEPAADQPTDD